MARVGFDYDPVGSDGVQRNETRFGGIGNVLQGTNANGTPIIVDTGRRMEVDRYRGLGDAAAAREAYRVDFGKAQADELRAAATRNQQVNAIRDLGSAARGSAPSAANILGGQVAGQSLQSAMQAQAGARGGLASAHAQRQAMMGQQAQQAAGVGQFASMRAGEMADARGALLGASSSLRGQDYQGQGLAQQRAEMQAHAEMAQRDMNQDAQMAFERQAYGVNAAELERDLRSRGGYVGQMARNVALRGGDQERSDAMTGAVIGGAANAFSSMAKMGNDGPDGTIKGSKYKWA